MTVNADRSKGYAIWGKGSKTQRYGERWRGPRNADVPVASVVEGMPSDQRCSSCCCSEEKSYKEKEWNLQEKWSLLENVVQLSLVYGSESWCTITEYLGQ